MKFRCSRLCATLPVVITVFIVATTGVIVWRNLSSEDLSTHPKGPVNESGRYKSLTRSFSSGLRIDLWLADAQSGEGLFVAGIIAEGPVFGAGGSLYELPGTVVLYNKDGSKTTVDVDPGRILYCDRSGRVVDLRKALSNEDISAVVHSASDNFKVSSPEEFCKAAVLLAARSGNRHNH